MQVDYIDADIAMQTFFVVEFELHARMHVTGRFSSHWVSEKICIGSCIRISNMPAEERNFLPHLIIQLNAINCYTIFTFSGTIRIHIWHKLKLWNFELRYPTHLWIHYLTLGRNSSWQSIAGTISSKWSICSEMEII